MADKEIKIKLSAVANMAAIKSANEQLAKLATDAGRGNQTLRQSTMRAAREFYSIGDAADKAATRAVLSAKQIEEAWRKAMAKPTDEAKKKFFDLESVAKGALNGIGGKFKQLGADFMRGGIWGMAANLVVSAFGWAWNKLKEGAERTAKRMERVFQDSMAAIKDGAADVDKAFDKANAAIDKSISRFDSMTNSVKELTKAEIELARQTAIANGMSKEDADAAASDLTAQVDYEAEEARLKHLIEQEQKRIDAAKEAEEKTAEYVANATAKKIEAEKEYAKKRDEYVARNAMKEQAGTMMQSTVGAFWVPGVTAEEARKSREEAALDFAESEEGKKVADKVKQLKDILAGIKTDEKALAEADDARAKIENAERALEALYVKREARELSVQNDIAAKVEDEAKAREEAEVREAEKVAAEKLRLAEKVAAEEARLDAERFREQQRIERELAAQRIADLRKELSEHQRMESEARTRQSAAAGSLSQAWGWYRDKNQMQAVIDEQKAQAAAEVQWQKDFERLKTWRRDWRTAEFGSLSAADESVRQVALAKEEKAAADRAVLETAENTRNLAEKIDELLAMK